jgi:uncharacterized protein YdeI (YjbR/CyaY-like superfamily)
VSPPKKRAAADREQVLVETRAQWRRWLSRHHASSPGIWLVRWKKGKGPHLPYDDVVEEALCFGWIDSLPRAIDDERGALLLTPRKSGSGWSAANKERVSRLEEAGAMAAAGAEVVAAARADGSFDRLDAVSSLDEPADLRAALDAVPVASANWASFPPSARRGILEWLAAAKTETTRRKRLETIVSEAAQGRRANQWRPPASRPPRAR